MYFIIVVLTLVDISIDINNNEITPDISLPKVYVTNEQRVLLSNKKNINCF